MLPALASVLVVLALAPGIEVAGASDCPTPGEVSARVAALLPSSGAAPSQVELAGTGGELRLRLRQGSAVTAERRLPSAGVACADLASAAAAVIATWASDVHPDFAPARPLPDASLSGVGGNRTARTTELAFAGAAGLAASAAPVAGTPGWAVGVHLAGHLHRPGRGLGARLTLTGHTERRLTVGHGQAWTRRWAATLGPEYRFYPGQLNIHLGAGGAVSWFAVRGQGFARNLSAGEVDFGGAAHLALSLAGRRVSPFAGLEATAWPRRREVLDLQTGAGRRVPPVEVGLVLGARVGGP